jgi:hypothetical protein
MNRTYVSLHSTTVGERMGETTTADTCSRHTRAKSQGRPPGISGSQPTGQRRPTHHDLSLDEPLSGSRRRYTTPPARHPRHPRITAVSCLGMGISRGRPLRSVRRCTPGSARVRACCAWAMTARPASVSDVGSGQRPFLRDAFAKELRVDVRQPEDNRRDQDGQCNALGIGRTGLRETTITAAARTRL